MLAVLTFYLLVQMCPAFFVVVGRCATPVACLLTFHYVSAALEDLI